MTVQVDKSMPLVQNSLLNMHLMAFQVPVPQKRTAIRINGFDLWKTFKKSSERQHDYSVTAFPSLGRLLYTPGCPHCSTVREETVLRGGVAQPPVCRRYDYGLQMK